MKTTLQDYKDSQKQYSILNNFDFDNIDNLEFAIYKSRVNQNEKKEVENIFEKLKNLIADAELYSIIESNNFLKELQKTKNKTNEKSNI